jgi:hypothetical protein
MARSGRAGAENRGSDTVITVLSLDLLAMTVCVVFQALASVLAARYFARAAKQRLGAGRPSEGLGKHDIAGCLDKIGRSIRPSAF